MEDKTKFEMFLVQMYLLVHKHWSDLRRKVFLDGSKHHISWYCYLSSFVLLSNVVMTLYVLHCFVKVCQSLAKKVSVFVHDCEILKKQGLSDPVAIATTA